MKNLLKLIFIFFTFLFCISQQETFEVQPINYIQNDYQKVVLISNTLSENETLSNPKDGLSNSFSGDNNSSLTNIFKNKNLLEKPSQPSWESIHNLSTNIETDISIRAP